MSHTGSRQREPSKMLDPHSVNTEKLVALRRSRGGYAGHLTKKINMLIQLMNCEAGLAELQVAYGKMTSAFQEFYSVHQDFMDLVMNIQPDRATDEEAWYYNLEERFLTAKGQYTSLQEQHSLQESVKPQDSVSQVGSGATSRASRASSTRTKAVAKRAALEVKARALQELQELELSQLQLLQEAVRQREEAERQREEAERHRREEAEHQRREAERQRQEEAERQREEAERQRREATHRQREKEQWLELEKKKMELRRQQLQMQTELAAAAAEEEVLTKSVHYPEYLYKGSKVSQTFVDNCSNVYSDSVHDNVVAKEVPYVKLQCGEIPDSTIASRAYRHLGGPISASTAQKTSQPTTLRSDNKGSGCVGKSMLNPFAPEWTGSPIRGSADERPDETFTVRQVAQLMELVKSPQVPVRDNSTIKQSSEPVLKDLSQTLGDIQERSHSALESQMMIQRQMLNAIRLPKTSLITFDGNPLKYWTFTNAFDSCVDKTDVEDSDRLNRLFEYCTGKALKVIQPCALMAPSEGYKKARYLLKQRFGNDFVISKACISKITEGPPVKPNDGEALQDFADDVRGCMETLRAMNKLKEVDSQDRMVKILTRLPMYLQTQWRKEAYKARERFGEYPNFDEFLRFLEMAAGEANDPVFGNVGSVPKEAKAKPSLPKKKGSSFNVKVTDTASPSSNQGTKLKPTDTPLKDKPKNYKCRMCDADGHTVSGCDKFKKMPLEKRREVAKEKRLCFNCLDYSNHISKECKRPRGCQETDCKGKHATLLHLPVKATEPESSKDGEQREEQKAPDKPVEAKSYACGQSDVESTKVALPIVSVFVRGKGQTNYIHTHALLDPGSNKTFCSKDLVKQLELKGEKTSLSLETLSEGKDMDALEVSLEVTATKGPKNKRKIVKLPRVYALTRFPSLRDSTPSQADVKKWDHLKYLEIPLREKSGITLLIGQDVPDALIPLEVRRGRENEPYATRTSLGWTLNGPMQSGNSNDSAVCHFIQADQGPDVRLEAQVEQFWKLDVGQTLAGSLPQMSQDDKRVLDVWNESIKLIDQHYEMDIPFKVTPPELIDNKKMAEKRLQSLGRRLSKDPDLHRLYKTGIEDLLQKGYAEPVQDSEDEKDDGIKWYIPHHSVTSPNKPGKLRIVFDCAAEYGGTSLNKQVLQGPDMTNKLIGVLLRFREDNIAIMGDIEAMFHQVRVSPQHRDALRFLWWKDGNPDLPPQTYKMAVHLFGGVWSPSCASFALKRTAEDHKTEFDEETVKTVMENFYADDCLKSVSTVDQAKKLVEELCQLLRLGGFRLTKWISNSKEVIESVPPEDRAKEVKDLDLDSAVLPIERALGVQWDTQEDMFGIRIKQKEVTFTRRGLLRVVSSVYDPLGFVCPFILQAKKIFQDECKREKGWDDELEPDNTKKWKRWLEDLPRLEEFKIKRCLIPQDFGKCVEIQLHHFSDASEEAYGTTSYLRVMNEQGNVHCSFLLGKSRLAPVKHMTIPRLELSAAVVAVKMDSLLRREIRLEVTKSIFWTDSMIVLQYIKNTTKRFQTFVANRVSIIHDGSSPTQWRYVDTKSNPADDASRGLSASEMLSSRRWKHGPDFLWEDESQWPVVPQRSPDLLLDDQEVKKEAKVCIAVTDSEDRLEQMFKRYSSWFRLKKAVAWLIRFGEWLRKGKPKLNSDLTVDEIQNAEKSIIRHVQRRRYSDELTSLASGKQVSHKSTIFKLEPFRDQDSMLRVQGRLQRAPITDSAKHPLILPKEHHVAELIVRHTHEWISKHSGREYVLSRLREKYWIPQGRPLVNKVLQNCVICKKLRGRLGVQRMADLPTDRVTPHKPPFTYTGVDCFGPFYVKRGRSQEKRYGCLFTCLTTRAIHIEVLNSMDGDSFINSLIRFISRRGVPEKIRSDNGTNFVGGNKELHESIRKWNEDHQTKESLLIREIKWEFNPPAASHMGGVWERQIRTVRKVLNSILKDQVLDDERLSTLFCEVEYIVNGRPLTPVSDDPKDLKPLSPNDLLQLGVGLRASPGTFRKEDMYGRRWRHVQYLADQFWKRWVKEYLPTLQLRQKWLETKRNLQTNDVVLVMDDSLPRNSWPLGRVVKTFPGKDGLVRSVEVKTATNVLVRPIDKLCLLESVTS